jgi:hypothetical protein
MHYSHTLLGFSSDVRPASAENKNGRKKKSNNITLGINFFATRK